MKSTIKTSQWGGIKMAYRQGSVDEQVIRETIEDDMFFKGAPEYVIKQNDTIIDVGAHIGAFSVLAAKRIPNGKIYAIEPSQESYTILEQNIRMNGFSNIICFKRALYDRKGEIKLFYDNQHGNWGHSIVKEFSSEGEIVQCDTLQNFFADNDIKACGFMKFNCEGAEFSILLSTPFETLKKISVILILYHCDIEKKYSLSELTSHLRKADFIIVKRFQFGDRGWMVAHRSFLRHLILSTKHAIKRLLIR
jgi:FkbM family methyltransferase